MTARLPKTPKADFAAIAPDAPRPPQDRGFVLRRPTIEARAINAPLKTVRVCDGLAPESRFSVLEVCDA
jgi:hypothetical protein